MINEELIAIIFGAMAVALLVAGILAVDRRQGRSPVKVTPAHRPDDAG